MLQYNPTVSGSLTVTGTISATQGITGSFSGSIAGLPTDTLAFSSSLAERITNTELTSSEYVSTSGSLSTRVTAAEATSSAYVAASRSLSTRVTDAEATASAYVTASGSLAARITSNEARTGSYATTGSNYFIGTQVITGSVYIANDLIVQGSSSLQNITASAVSIGTNTVILNTDSPAVRFAGISVRDSGSNSSVTSSIWYDSLNNHWIYQNESGSSYSGGMFISGPRNTGSLGDEAGMDSGYITKGLGGDHIGPSIIFESGSTNVGIGTNVPTAKLDILASSAGSTANVLRLKNTSNDTSTGLRVKWDFQSVEGAYLDVTTNSGGSKSMVLYLSAANGTPAEVLTIAGSNKAATFASSVGIGSSPSYTLDVRGDVNGDVVLARFQNRDGNASTGTYIGFSTGYAAMATIGAKREGAENDSSLVFSPMLNENAVERMRITSGGSVGIGTTNPAKKLDVYDSNANATAQLKLRNSGTTAAAYLGAFSGNLYLSAGGTYDGGWTTDGTNGVANIVMETSNGGSVIAFGTAASNTSPTERVRITSGGNVGIGITSPSERLHLNNSSGTGTFVRFQDTGGGGVYIGGRSETMELYAGGTERMRITGGAGNDLVIGFQGGNPYTAASRGSIFLNGSSNSLYGWGTGGTARGYMYHNGTNVFLENSVSGNNFNILQVGAGSINFSTNGATRMQIMGGGAVGTGQSANGTPLRATLVKTGTTSITFNMSLNTIGAWRPGFATIRVSGAQNGLQEAYAAWFIYRITGYFGAGTAINLLSSGGDTGSVSISSSSDQNSPQAFSITITDSGSTTDTMIADLDVAYHEGIISLT